MNPAAVLTALSYVEHEEKKLPHDYDFRKIFSEEMNNDLHIQEGSPQEKYNIIKQIGSGGYGRIYLVKRKKFDEEGHEIYENLANVTDEELFEMPQGELLALKYVFESGTKEKL